MKHTSFSFFNWVWLVQCWSFQVIKSKVFQCDLYEVVVFLDEVVLGF